MELNEFPCRAQAAKNAPVEELLHGSFETPEWADDPLEPSGEESGDPVEELDRPRATEPEPAAAPLLDPGCIEVTISGRGFGQAGPFFVTADTFHKLCFAARNREVGP